MRGIRVSAGDLCVAACCRIDNIVDRYHSWRWLAIPILVCINGFFVAAEFALVSMRKTRVEELVTQEVPRSLSLMEAITHLGPQCRGGTTRYHPRQP